jgi:hypothetical protein
MADYQVEPGNLSGDVFLGLSTVLGAGLDFGLTALVCFFGLGINGFAERNAQLLSALPLAGVSGFKCAEVILTGLVAANIQ